MLLVDTNVLLAAADTSTAEHQRCAALLDERTDLAITTPVAAECSWMIESRLGPRAPTATPSNSSPEPPTGPLNRQNQGNPRPARCLSREWVEDSEMDRGL